MKEPVSNLSHKELIHAAFRIDAYNNSLDPTVFKRSDDMVRSY